MAGNPGNITGALIKSMTTALKILTGYTPGCCRFYPTCSDYATEALKVLPLPVALLKIAGRILRCHPGFPVRYDPVVPNNISTPEK